MDAMVAAALRKWPNVPHCHGWLGLDARGQWYMRDAACQARGPFAQAKGSRIDHAALLGFIARNYACDDAGGWYFQNGPQRVYVDLEVTPWIWRVAQTAQGWVVCSHTDVEAVVQQAWLDEHDRLFLHTDRGLGLVHSQDMVHAVQAVETGEWVPQPLRFDEMPARFGFQRQPRPTAPAVGVSNPASAGDAVA